jgi:phosphotriesterase-related protein
MPKVDTLAGPVDVDALGVTYMHEHVFIVSPEMQWYWPGYGGWSEDFDVERARGFLLRLRDDFGCETLVDPTVAGIGRNIRAVARALDGLGINLIAATGWYIYNELPFTLSAKDQDQKIETLRNLFLADVERGLEGTGIKPGVIKCAIDKHGLTPDVEAVIRAAARAHLETRLPIMTHTDPASRNGLDQQRIFREEGVDLAAVVIGHCNESDDLGYLEGLIENGTYIGFDRCGFDTELTRPGIPTHEHQIDNLAELVRRGHADRIVLSHDSACFLDVRSREALERKGVPYSFLHERTLPGLRERGVSERDIEQMLIGNPREYFSRAARTEPERLDEPAHDAAETQLDAPAHDNAK